MTHDLLDYWELEARHAHDWFEIPAMHEWQKNHWMRATRVEPSPRILHQNLECDHASRRNNWITADAIL